MADTVQNLDRGIFGGDIPLANEISDKTSPMEAENKSESQPAQSSSKIHRYPIYMDGADVSVSGEAHIPAMKECIHFTAIKQGGASFTKNAKGSLESAKARALAANRKKFTDAEATINSKLDISIPEQMERLKAANSFLDEMDEKGITKAADITDKDTNLGNLGIAFVRDQLDNIRQPAEILEHCFLYMPNSVQFAESANWGSKELGALGNMINEAMRDKGTTSDILKNFGVGSATEMAKAGAIALSGGAAGIAGALGVTALLDGIGSGIKAAGRFVENPYEEQLFDGIGFRSFTFDFAFAASSTQEYQEVEKIIKMFRKHSRPTFTVEGSQALYTFPNEFGISFKHLDGEGFKENKKLPRIHNCVCTSVNTNYTPEGFWMSHKDGRSITVTLSLSFTETKKITQVDIDGGY